MRFGEYDSKFTLHIKFALCMETYSKFNVVDMVTKGNDMELFHFLSTPLVISQTERKLMWLQKKRHKLVKQKGS
ncbi:13192_t:CDS:2 [Acaulospora morrowiae]|uniref:13192_t:CDS:1 n=1 Tax=Acaulospora morrowiae TaxID=94023 RepID=A0A9N8ZWY3_9GLOM|nr:13192_t:CDS:2 [Acaulospora morrowiae]